MGRVVSSAPRSRAKPMTARRAWSRMVASCVARSSGLRQLALGGIAIAVTFTVGSLIGSHTA